MIGVGLWRRVLRSIEGFARDVGVMEGKGGMGKGGVGNEMVKEGEGLN